MASEMAIKRFLEEDDDLAFEEEVAHDPYKLKSWWEYIDSKKRSKQKVRNLLFERALKHLPGSYKLWHRYLLERVKNASKKPITHEIYEVVNNAFERSLVFLHKMPRLWIEYCEFLMKQGRITQTRKAFDRALQALPVTQHDRIWPLYIKFVRMIGVWETAIRVYKRYICFEPNAREEFVDYLVSVGQLDSAAVTLAAMVNDEDFVSPTGRTKHSLWMQLCKIISKNPAKIKSLPVEAIIRSGLSRFTDEVGKLWVALAEYFLRSGRFERARDIYEEAVTTVKTVRDFTFVFDAYAKFEEMLLEASMAQAAESGAYKDGRDTDGGVDLRLARLEHLVERRPLLLSSVLLRQNPNNVHEWHKRVRVYLDAEDPVGVVNTYVEACRTVDPRKATGKSATLWLGLARFYEKHGKIEDARKTLLQARDSKFKTDVQLAMIVCGHAEMEIRAGNYEEARRIAREATTPPPRHTRAKLKGAAAFLHKNVKVWCLYVDLEECLGTIKTTSAAYQEAIDLKVATPLMILNYANYLEERDYFEDAFKAYERGVALFAFPHVKDIWLAYLARFVARYGGRKLERARDLFEQALEKVPADSAKTFYTLYANLEEEHGLVRHAMSIYDRATKAVPDEEKYAMYITYIMKAEEFYGATATREIYAAAIEALPDNQVKDMCMRFAKLETRLGEIDRARALYVHASQFCDPRTVVTFWKDWRQFEIDYGNGDTFNDMRRVKRSVAAQYSQVNYLTADAMAGEGGEGGEGGGEGEGAGEVTGDGDPDRIKRARPEEGTAAAPAPAPAPAPAAPSSAMEGLESAAAAAAPVADPSAIDLDDEDEEPAAAGGEVEIQTLAVPESVFGDARKVMEQQKAEAAGQEKKLGALERFRRKA